MIKRNGAGTRFAVLLTVAVLMAVLLLPAANVSAATRLSETENTDGKQIDGIVADPHNSYGWCGEMFAQDDGNDYLWVGTNRDLGGGLIPGGMDELVAMYEAMGIPAPSDDRAGKIYRFNMTDPAAGWELMWEDPAFSGYRKMILFDDHLFVFVGLTNIKDGFDYTVIYRFASDFSVGDTPDVVLWAPLEPGESDCFRAAAKDDSKLYVGTFDCIVYSTDGSGLVPYDVSGGFTGAGWMTGWDKVIDLKDEFTAPEDDNRVWDMIVYNDCLYSFVTSEIGFMVFKLDLSGGGCTQVVGDDNVAAYPFGLGLRKHVAASPFLYDGYVYVSTFAYGPAFLVQVGTGVLALALGAPVMSANAMLKAFNEMYCPATIYRFDANDVWETVVGDTTGQNVARDSSGETVPHIGDMRAGFFPGADAFPNISSNQYIWWMAEYGGKLYASTWDMGVFRGGFASYPIVLDAVTMNMIASNPYLRPLIPLTENVMSDLSALIDAAGANDEITEAVSECMANAIDAVMRGAYDEVRGILEKLAEDIADALTSDTSIPMDLILNLRDSAAALYDAITTVTAMPGATDSMRYTMSAVFMFSMFADDRTNPEGFDLFCSDDGVNWYPYTVNGLGDPHNYGGRVLLSTEKGLFVLTANPFNGCQVWRVDDGLEPGVFLEMPDKISLRPGESVTLRMTSVGMDPEKVAVTVGDGKAITATVAIVGNDMTVYASAVTKKFDPSVYGGFVWSEEGGYGYVYEVTLTAEKTFKGTVDIVVTSGGFETSIPVTVRVHDTTDDWKVPALVVAIIVALVIAGCLYIKKP